MVMVNHFLTNNQEAQKFGDGHDQNLFDHDHLAKKFGDGHGQNLFDHDHLAKKFADGHGQSFFDHDHGALKFADGQKKDGHCIHMLIRVLFYLGFLNLLNFQKYFKHGH